MGGNAALPPGGAGTQEGLDPPPTDPEPVHDRPFVRLDAQNQQGAGNGEIQPHPGSVQGRPPIDGKGAFPGAPDREQDCEEEEQQVDAALDDSDERPRLRDSPAQKPAGHQEQIVSGSPPGIRNAGGPSRNTPDPIDHRERGRDEVEPLEEALGDHTLSIGMSPVPQPDGLRGP